MVIMDGLGDHFGVLFGTKMWLKQYVFVCFCLGGPSGVSLVSFICFGLAWVAIWGPHGVLLGVFCSFCGACWDLWDPFGSLWAHMCCFGGPFGDPVGSWGVFLDPLGDLLGAFWDILLYPFGKFLGTLWVYQVWVVHGRSMMEAACWWVEDGKRKLGAACQSQTLVPS